MLIDASSRGVTVYDITQCPPHWIDLSPLWDNTETTVAVCGVKLLT